MYRNILRFLLSVTLILTPFSPINQVFPTVYTLRQYSMLIFILMICLFCLWRRRFIDIGWYPISLYFVAIFIWGAIGTYNGYDALAEASPLVVMMMTFISIVIAYREGFISKEYIKKLAFILMLAWCGVYFFIAISILFGIIPLQLLYPIMNVYMQANGSLRMGDGFLGLLPRIGAGVNIVPLIIYAFYIYEKKKGGIFVWIILLFYTIIDYGRIDMMFFAILTLFQLYRIFKDIVNLKKICKVLVSLLLLLTCLWGTMSAHNLDMDELYDGWTARYDRPSDARTMQVAYLTDYIQEKPIIGYGLGAFSPEYTRSDNHWVYEMQFHAFFMQMGILGFALIVFNYLVFFLRTVYRNIGEQYISLVLACILFWLIDCIFQGGLYHNDGRVVCILIYILSRSEDDNIGEGNEK